MLIYIILGLLLGTLLGKSWEANHPLIKNAITNKRLLISVLREEARTLWWQHRWKAIVLVVSCLGVACLYGMPFSGRGTYQAQIHEGRSLTAFTWNYSFNPSPGIRAWSLDQQGRWRERYPDGHVGDVFDVTGEVDVNGCQGSLTRSNNHGNFEIFIPDAGCRSMTALFR